MFLRPSARASPKNSIVASFFFVLPFFFWRFWRFFPSLGEILTSCFRLFFNAALVFFSWFFVLPKNRGFCGPQTSSMKKEKTPLTKHTVSFLFLLCFFFSVVCRKRFILPDDLFLKEEKNLSNIEHSFSFFLTRRRIKRARAKHEKKRPCLLCVVRFVAASKKDIPHQSKVPDDTRRPQRERTRRQQTTTTTTTTNDALWRKERRHFWTTTTTTTTTTGQQK